MEINESQSLASSRDRLMDRLRTRYPEKRFGAPDGQDGQGGQMDDLDQAALDFLDELETRNKTYGEHADKVTKFFKTNEMGAAFFNRWVKTGDPVIAFCSVFGPDAIEALKSEEAQARLAEVQQEFLKNKADNDAWQTEREANFAKSLDTLNSVGDRFGLDENQKKDLFMRVHNLGINILDGIYTEEDFIMAYHAMNFDRAVEDARHEGEVAGRNTRARDIMKKGRPAETLPPTFQGQGPKSEEVKPRENSRYQRAMNLFGLD